MRPGRPLSRSSWPTWASAKTASKGLASLRCQLGTQNRCPAHSTGVSNNSKSSSCTTNNCERQRLAPLRMSAHRSQLSGPSSTASNSPGRLKPKKISQLSSWIFHSGGPPASRSRFTSGGRLERLAQQQIPPFHQAVRVEFYRGWSPWPGVRLVMIRVFKLALRVLLKIKQLVGEKISPSYRPGAARWHHTHYVPPITMQRF